MFTLKKLFNKPASRSARSPSDSEFKIASDWTSSKNKSLDGIGVVDIANDEIVISIESGNDCIELTVYSGKIINTVVYGN